MDTNIIMGLIIIIIIIIIMSYMSFNTEKYQSLIQPYIAYSMDDAEIIEAQYSKGETGNRGNKGMDGQNRIITKSNPATIRKNLDKFFQYGDNTPVDTAVAPVDTAVAPVDTAATAAPLTWTNTHVTTDNYMSDCAVLLPNTNGSLDECKTRCKETDGCTSLNYDSSGDSGYNCHIKQCTDKKIYKKGEVYQLKQNTIEIHENSRAPPTAEYWSYIGENSVVDCTHTDNILADNVKDCIDKCGDDCSGFNYISDGGPYRSTPESPPTNCSLKKCDTATNGKMEILRKSPYSDYDGWFKTNEPNNYLIKNIGTCDMVDANGHVTIKAGTTSIKNDAFRGCETLKTITIPDGVTSIGKAAFRECHSLTSITIPNSVTNIGEEAFFECWSLPSIILPNNITTINKYTFFKCYDLSSIIIPDSVTSIGEHAFYLCKELKTIRIPNTVTSIGYAAFYQCSCDYNKYVSGAILSNCNNMRKWTIFTKYMNNPVPLRYNNDGYVECASMNGADCKWGTTGGTITASNPFVCSNPPYKGGWCGTFDAAHLKLHQPPN